MRKRLINTIICSFFNAEFSNCFDMKYVEVKSCLFTWRKVNVVEMALIMFVVRREQVGKAIDTYPISIFSQILPFFFINS